MAANSRLPSSVFSFVAMFWLIMRLFLDSCFFAKRRGLS